MTESRSLLDLIYTTTIVVFHRYCAYVEDFGSLTVDGLGNTIPNFLHNMVYRRLAEWPKVAPHLPPSHQTVPMYTL